MALCKNMTMLKFFRNSIDSLHVEMDYISKFLYWVRIKLPKWNHFLFSETSEAGSHKLFDFSIFKNIQLTWPLWIFSQKFIRDKLFHGRSLTIHPQLSWLDGKKSCPDQTNGGFHKNRKSTVTWPACLPNMASRNLICLMLRFRDFVLGRNPNYIHPSLIIKSISIILKISKFPIKNKKIWRMNFAFQVRFCEPKFKLSKKAIFGPPPHPPI